MSNGSEHAPERCVHAVDGPDWAGLRELYPDTEETSFSERVAAFRDAEVLVEGSYFKVGDLPRILGNYIRLSAEYARDAKALHVRLDALVMRHASALGAISRVRAAVMSTDGDYLDGSDFDGLAGEVQAALGPWTEVPRGEQP